jgi:hypothetical protein
MKKKLRIAITVVFISLLQSFESKAQVTIGSSAAPHSSAVLDLQSTTRGFLPPRMTSAQRNAIGTPAPGLVVFDTDVNQLFFFDGAQWLPLSAGAAGNSLIAAQVSQIPAEQKTNGYFGIDVAMGDNYAVAGAPQADNGATLTTGAAYVYKKAAAGGWVQVAKLFASDPQTGSYFGGSVAMAGNYIVVGAPLFNVGVNTGAGKIYVFVKGVGDTWTQQTSFTRQDGPATGDNFGFSIAVSIASASGPEIIAGAPLADIVGTDRGAVYVYRFNGTTWNYQAMLSPSSDLGDGDQFGYKVDIDGDYFAVAAPLKDTSGCSIIIGCQTFYDIGEVFVYFYSAGIWGQQTKLATGVRGGEFGLSLSLKGDMLAVGAPYSTLYGGAATNVYIYVFQRVGSNWNSYSNVILTNAQGLDINGFYGASVCLDNDKLVVGLPGGLVSHTGSVPASGPKGYVLIYKKVSGSNNYYLSKLLNDNEPIVPVSGNIFGNACSIKNGNYIIGIPGKAVNGISRIGTISFGYVE